MHDVPLFDRFAPVYDLLLPDTDSVPLSTGLGHAARPVECVLDLGGGTGRAGRAIDPAAVVFDASGPMLESARESGFPSVRGDVRHLPFAAESVDAVVSVDALHHLPAIEAVLAEVERVLEPGGVFVVRDFDPTTLRGRGLALGERLVGFESTFFSAAALVERLAATGLDPTVLEDGFVYTVVATKPTDAQPR
jgi:demethylmenaquinone methyltransferase/2-methoxy-6-polyprenyl-1,4-benzoquinol methylase